MLNAGLIEERCQREASEIKAAAAGTKTRSANRTNMATFEHTSCRREESRKYKVESRKRRRRDVSPLSVNCISSAPAELDRYLTALPAMSLTPVAPLLIVIRRATVDLDWPTPRH